MNANFTKIQFVASGFKSSLMLNINWNKLKDLTYTLKGQPNN